MRRVDLHDRNRTKRQTSGDNHFLCAKEEFEVTASLMCVAHLLSEDLWVPRVIFRWERNGQRHPEWKNKERGVRQTQWWLYQWAHLSGSSRQWRRGRRAVLRHQTEPCLFLSCRDFYPDGPALFCAPRPCPGCLYTAFSVQPTLPCPLPLCHFIVHFLNWKVKPVCYLPPPGKSPFLFIVCYSIYLKCQHRLQFFQSNRKSSTTSELAPLSGHRTTSLISELVLGLLS